MAPNDLKILQRIANILIVNAPFAPSNGLLNGKMGFTLFFYRLSKATGNPIYEEFAGELLDQIMSQLSVTAPVNFSSGLAGIGWGIECLLQNNYIETGDQDVLDEVDTAVFQLDKKKPQLIRDYTGLYGYGLYYLIRSKNRTVWNEEALRLILDDIGLLLDEVLPTEVIVSTDYLISIVYVLLEIRNWGLAPSWVASTAIKLPDFLRKHPRVYHPCEQDYLQALLAELKLEPMEGTSSKELKLASDQEKMEVYSQAGLYRLVFPSLVVSDPFLQEEVVLDDQVFWEQLLDKHPDYVFKYVWAVSGNLLGQ